MVLPDLDWNCDSNDVTRIRRKNVKGELNRIKKTESNPVKKVSKIQPNTVSQIKSNKITSAEMTILMTELAFDNLIILCSGGVLAEIMTLTECWDRISRSSVS